MDLRGHSVKSAAALCSGSKDNFADESVDNYSMEQGSSMFEVGEDTVDQVVEDFMVKDTMDQVVEDSMGEVADDTIDKVIEDSMEGEESDLFGDFDWEFDEDSMAYLSRLVVEDSEEEGDQDEAYLKSKKDLALRSARDDTLRMEARAKNAACHKKKMKRIRNDFLSIYVPLYYKKGTK